MIYERILSKPWEKAECNHCKEEHETEDCPYVEIAEMLNQEIRGQCSEISSDSMEIDDDDRPLCDFPPCTTEVLSEVSSPYPSREDSWNDWMARAIKEEEDYGRELYETYLAQKKIREASPEHQEWIRRMKEEHENRRRSAEYIEIKLYKTHEELDDYVLSTELEEASGIRDEETNQIKQGHGPKRSLDFSKSEEALQMEASVRWDHEQEKEKCVVHKYGNSNDLFMFQECREIVETESEKEGHNKRELPVQMLGSERKQRICQKMFRMPRERCRRELRWINPPSAPNEKKGDEIAKNETSGKRNFEWNEILLGSSFSTSKRKPNPNWNRIQPLQTSNINREGIQTEELKRFRRAHMTDKKGEIAGSVRENQTEPSKHDGTLTAQRDGTAARDGGGGNRAEEAREGHNPSQRRIASCFRLPFGKMTRWTKKPKEEPVNFGKLLDILETLTRSDSFAEIMYNRFEIRDFLNKVAKGERKLEELDKVRNIEHCLKIMSRDLPEKYNDPKSSVVNIVINNHRYEGIIDPRVNYNIMPARVYYETGLKEKVEITKKKLMVDNKKRKPRGYIRGVNIVIDGIRYIADFTILDMEQGKEIPITLGRPHLGSPVRMIKRDEPGSAGTKKESKRFRKPP